MTNDDEFNKALERFKIALETRNFEIALFWKRCNYFLVLNTALATVLAAGLFASFNNGNSTPSWLLIGVCLAGIFVCVAWIKVGLGSKFWQSHWEYVVEKTQTEINFEQGKDGDDRKDYFSREGVKERVAAYLNENLTKADIEKEEMTFFPFLWRVMFLSPKLIFGKGEKGEYNKLVIEKPSVSGWMQRMAMFFLMAWVLGGIFLVLWKICN